MRYQPCWHGSQMEIGANYRSKVLWSHVSLQNCTVLVRIRVLLLKDTVKQQLNQTVNTLIEKQC